VSLIQSNYMGLGSNVATSTGFILQNRGAGFTLQPGHPNQLAPGKRPFHTLSPTLWTRRGTLAALLGTRGGHQQPQYLLRLARLLFSAGEAPATAQDAPRWADASDAGHPHRVKMEARVGEQTVSALQRRGHEVVVAADYEPGWGPASVVTVSSSGLRTGAADPRTSTTSAAVRG
jgi:gamma-glutamyltranspeptidase/glutathione hydrolase